MFAKAVFGRVAVRKLEISCFMGCTVCARWELCSHGATLPPVFAKAVFGRVDVRKLGISCFMFFLFFFAPNGQLVETALA